MLVTRLISIYTILFLIVSISTNNVSAQGFLNEKQSYDILSLAIRSSFLSNKLSIYPEEQPNGGLFIFERVEVSNEVSLITHIIFNQENSTTYTERFRELADDVAAKISNKKTPNTWQEKYIIVPLAIINSGHAYSTPTVFHFNPEARKLMEFYSRQKDYRILPTIRAQQVSRL